MKPSKSTQAVNKTAPEFGAVLFYADAAGSITPCTNLIAHFVRTGERRSGVGSHGNTLKNLPGAVTKRALCHYRHTMLLAGHLSNDYTTCPASTTTYPLTGN